MRGKKKSSILAVVVAFVTLVAIAVLPANAGFQYVHDPMQDPRVKDDIIVNPEAVYGYSPNPESVRLGVYAKYDWSDEKLVADNKATREEYHQSIETELLAMVDEMKLAGNSTEEIACAVSTRRNELRLEEAEKSGTLEETKQSNLEKYGNENGPTPEYLYEKYGSWEKVAVKAFSTNIGMDVCLGLYDKYYDTYGFFDSLEKRTGDITKVTVSRVPDYAYTGKQICPHSFVVYDGLTVLVENTDYTITYGKNISKTGTITIQGTGEYSGKMTLTFRIANMPNTLKVSPAIKNIKASALKKKAQQFIISVKKAQGKVTYLPANEKSKKALKITTSGKVTIKKGTKRGIYKITVKAAGNTYYKPAKKTVKIVVK